MGPLRRVGKAAGLLQMGINLQRLPPGTRSSWPHAEEDEEEFVYVIEGEVDAWIDGDLHRMSAGDFAAFPAGTGISHCFINNSQSEALLMGWGSREAGQPHPLSSQPVSAGGHVAKRVVERCAIAQPRPARRPTRCLAFSAVIARDHQRTRDISLRIARKGTKA